MHPFYTTIVSRYGDAAKWLKRLVQRNVDATCLEAVWRAIGSMGHRRSVTQHSCSAPSAVLKNLVLESDISITEVEEMLSELDGFQTSHQKYVNGTIQTVETSFSKETHIFYTVMFWEAPEQIIDHFIDQVPDHVELDCLPVWRSLLLTKYSEALCKKLFRRCAKQNIGWQSKLQQLRPSLFE